MTTAPFGIYPMLYAFFDARGALRPEAFDRQVDAAIASGAAGIAVLGLGTEVGKLTRDERAGSVARVVERVRGRLPVAVTVTGPTAAEQIDFARMAAAAGASWLLLQPPRADIDAEGLEAFFAEVLAAVDVPVGLQNAPQFLGTGLATAALVRLADRFPHFAVVKLECPAVDLAAAAEALAGCLALFNGRCGLELPDNLRGGAVGIIPGIETIDRQVAVYEAWRAGEVEKCEALFAEIVPAISAIMQGIDHFVAYGKLLAAERLGLDYGGTRDPHKPLTPFGIASIRRFAGRLGPLPST